MRVLYLTHRLPYAPNRGDRVRAFHTLRLLAQRADVDLISLVHDEEEGSHLDGLRTIASSVTAVRVPRVRNLIRAACALPTAQPLTHVLLDAPDLDDAVRSVCRRHRPDVVLAFCSGMARLAVRPPLDNVPFVLDMVDVDSRKWEDLAAQMVGPRRWVYRREAQRLATFERSVMTRAFATLVVNPREAAIARTVAHGATVRVVENGVDFESLQPPTHAERDRTARVVFCGVMNYAPNEEAAIWLARTIWPLVHERRPDARLTLVGARPTRRLQRICQDAEAVDLVGTVPDVRPFLWGAAVAAAPLRIARGIQNKVLEAVAAGLPVVITPAVAEGLPPGVRPACRVADSAEQFAGSLLELLGDAQERRRLLSGAALEDLAWHRTLEPLWGALMTATATATSRSRVS